MANDPDITPLDPLVKEDGARVATPAEWPARRAEILSLFTREMYGRSPGRPQAMAFSILEEADDALGGLATRRQVRISLTDRPEGQHIDLLLYIPNERTGPAPAFLGLNFGGNHTVDADPAIRPPALLAKVSGDGSAEDEKRGAGAGRWQVETVVRRGYALATAFLGDIDPDQPENFARSVRALAPELAEEASPDGDNFSTVGAWAWGLSRALDYLETAPEIDARRVAVCGHSRLGKAAIWAGATDERFALVISNDSGAGGAKLFRRGQGEDIAHLIRSFPTWFCTRFRNYNGRDTVLPFDQHMVLSLIAPRPLYVASAEQDAWADPEGEFLGAKGAEPVYRLLGWDGLPAETFPPVDHPVHGRIGYHVRTGGHDVTAYDWEQFLDFADRHLGSKGAHASPQE